MSEQVAPCGGGPCGDGRLRKPALSEAEGSRQAQRGERHHGFRKALQSWPPSRPRNLALEESDLSFSTN